MLALWVWASFALFVSLLTSTSAVVVSKHLLFLAGFNARLECQVNSTRIRWDFRPAHDTTQTVLLYNGVKVDADRFAAYLEPRTGDAILTISGAETRDAGVYLCYDPIADDKFRNTFHVSVLPELPECHVDPTNTVEENEQVRVTCGVSRLTDVVPEAACNFGTHSFALVRDRTSSNSTVDYVHGNTTAIKSLHSSTIKCSLKLMSSVTQQSVFEFPWKSSPLAVSYGPASVVVHTFNKTELDHGDTVMCEADGNPPPSYRFISGKVLVNGQQFTVDICALDDLDSSETTNANIRLIKLNCIAQRDRYAESKIVHLHVRELPDVKANCQSRIWEAVGGAVFCFVLLVLIIVAVIYFSRKGGRKRGMTTEMDILPATVRTGHVGSVDDAVVDGDTYDYVKSGDSDIPAVRHSPPELPRSRAYAALGDIKASEANTYTAMSHYVDNVVKQTVSDATLDAAAVYADTPANDYIEPAETNVLLYNV